MSVDQSTVKYHAIPGYPAYRVGDDGSIWSRQPRCGRGPLAKEWRRLKPSTAGHMKHHIVNLRPPVRKRYVHHLVLEAFVGPRPVGMECCHGNGIPTDNRLANLRWDTRKANRDDAVRHGTALRMGPRGNTHHWSLLTTQKVLKIREEYAQGGIPARQIAERYGVQQGAIYAIVKRKTWKHVA